MTALPKHTASASGQDDFDDARIAASDISPEAFAYEDDVTSDAIEQLRQKALAHRPSIGKWKVVSGYVGNEHSHVD